MNPNLLPKLRRSLVKHEDYTNFPYIDTVGKITIGIGYNLSDRGIDNEWINNQYLMDVNYFWNKLNSTFPWYATLNDDRQIVLIDMAFMGWQHFLEFQKLFAAIAEGDFKQAASEMLDSEWAKQVKGRATDLAQGMLTGTYNI